MPPRAPLGASGSPRPPRRITRRTAAVVESDAQQQPYEEAAQVVTMSAESVLVQATMSPSGHVRAGPMTLSQAPPSAQELPDSLEPIEAEGDEFDLDLFVAVLNQEARQKDVRRGSSVTPTTRQVRQSAGQYSRITYAPGHDPMDDEPYHGMDDDSLPTPTSSQFMDEDDESESDSLPSAQDAQFESADERVDEDTLPKLDDTQFALEHAGPRTRSRASAQPPARPRPQPRHQAAFSAPPLSPATKRRRVRRPASVESDSLPAIDDSQFRPAIPSKQARPAVPTVEEENDSLPQPTDSQFQPYSDVESDDGLPSVQDEQFAAPVQPQTKLVDAAVLVDTGEAPPELSEGSDDDLPSLGDTQFQQAAPEQVATRGEPRDRTPRGSGAPGTTGGTPRSVQRPTSTNVEVEIIRDGRAQTQRIAPPSPGVLRRPSRAYDPTEFASPEPGDLAEAELPGSGKKKAHATSEMPSASAPLRGPRKPRASRVAGTQRPFVAAASDVLHSTAIAKRKAEKSDVVEMANEAVEEDVHAAIDENRSFAPPDDDPLFADDPYDYEAYLDGTARDGTERGPATAPLQRPTKRPSTRGVNWDEPDPFMVDEDGGPLETDWALTVPADYEPPPTRLFGRLEGQVNQYSRLSGTRRWTDAETLLLWRTVQKVPVTVSNPMSVVAYLYGEYGQRSTELAFYNKQYMRQRMATVCKTRTRQGRPITGRARMFLSPSDPRRQEYDREFDAERRKVDDAVERVKHENMNDESEFGDERSARGSTGASGTGRRPARAQQQQRKRKRPSRAEAEEEWILRGMTEFIIAAMQRHSPMSRLSVSTTPSSTRSSTPEPSQSPEPVRPPPSRVVGGHALRRRAASATAPSVATRSERVLRRRTVQTYTSKRRAMQARLAASETDDSDADDESGADDKRPRLGAPAPPPQQQRVTRASARARGTVTSSVVTPKPAPAPRPPRKRTRGAAVPQVSAAPERESRAAAEVAAAAAAEFDEGDEEVEVGDKESEGGLSDAELEEDPGPAVDVSDASDGRDEAALPSAPPPTARSAADDHEASQAVRRELIRQKVLRGGL